MRSWRGPGTTFFGAGEALATARFDGVFLGLSLRSLTGLLLMTSLRMPAYSTLIGYAALDDVVSLIGSPSRLRGMAWVVSEEFWLAASCLIGAI